jgi:hypothetical protein
MTTDARFVDNINQLIQVKKLKSQSLSTVNSVPIASNRGIGEAVKKQVGSTGIASPLKEVPGTREYYDVELIKSSDGLFVIESKALKKSVFEDANKLQIIIEFDK